MFEGSCVALVTPFKNGGVDEAKLVELVKFHIDAGTDAIVPCGTTGESATLSHEEHIRVIDLVVKAAKKKLKVLAGTGSNSTAEAIRLTKAAAEAGADGALLITPYYNRPTQRGLFEHFQAVARAVKIPQVLYNVPGRTGINMLPQTVIDLARSEKNIVGLKEASGSLDQCTEVVQALGPGFDLFSGDDSLTLGVLSVGGKGVISVTANLVPKDMAAFWRAWKAGDVAGARTWHFKLYALHKAMFVETSPAPVKTAMGWLELCEPGLRLPLVPLEKASAEKLEKVMREYGLVAPKRRHAGC